MGKYVIPGGCQGWPKWSVKGKLNTCLMLFLWEHILSWMFTGSVLGINICKGWGEKDGAEGASWTVMWFNQDSAGPTGSSGTGVDVRVALDGDKEVGPCTSLTDWGYLKKARQVVHGDATMNISTTLRDN